MELLGLLAIPFLVGGVGFFVLRRTVSRAEYLAYTGISVALVLVGWWWARRQAIEDVEHLNGRIVEKVEERTPCCHCTVTCDRWSRRLECDRWKQRCAHDRDHRRALKIDTGEVHEVAVEACGAEVGPAAFERATVGEPAVVARTYANYLRADPGSLLRDGRSDLPWLERIPARPVVRDVHRVDRVVSDGVPVPPTWQARLDELNAELGPRLEIDLVVALTEVDDPRWAEALASAWVHGARNQLTIVLGVSADRSVGWARAVTLSRVGELEVDVRESLPGMSLRDPAVLDRIDGIVRAHWHRTPMSELRYLADAVRPGGRVLVLLYLFDVLLIVGLVWLAHRTDPFGVEGPSSLRARAAARARALPLTSWLLALAGLVVRRWWRRR